MKLFLIVAFLATASFAHPGKNEVELDAKQKEQLMNNVISDLEKTTDKKCMDDLKPNILNTASKYMTKIIKGEPFFKQDGKERTLKDFITHSQFYKTATSDTCKKSFIKGLGKALKFGVKAIGVAIITAIG